MPPDLEGVERKYPAPAMNSDASDPPQQIQINSDNVNINRPERSTTNHNTETVVSSLSRNNKDPINSTTNDLIQ